MVIKYYWKYNWKDYWQLIEPQYYIVFWKTIKVEKDFIFDGASIPRCWWLLSHPLSMPILKHALLHDFFYSLKNDTWIDRRYADMIFFDWIKKDWVVGALLFYIAVRLFWARNYWKPLPFKVPNNFYT